MTLGVGGPIAGFVTVALDRRGRGIGRFGCERLRGKQRQRGTGRRGTGGQRRGMRLLQRCDRGDAVKCPLTPLYELIRDALGGSDPRETIL